MSATKQKKNAARAKKIEGPFNVIIISFDTLRQDHLQAYGHAKQLAPTLDDLAARGVLFKEALGNCGWTLPQHMTLLTGLAPLVHGAIYLSYKRRCALPARFTTLAEIFQDNGYLTFGLANGNHYGGGWQYGFHRGFRSYTDLFPTNNGMELVVEPAMQCLRLAGSRPFFMYIHTNDTHEPFAASEPFGSQWGTSYQNRYEGEISYVDHQFGLILAELGRLGLAEQTLVVATSDHGTEFQEHGFLEKKLNLYEEIIRVPLIMTLPALLPAGKEVSGLCQTTDIAPAILDICSLPEPEQMNDQSLLPRIANKKAPSPEVVFAHTLHEKTYMYEHFSARSARHKFIRTVPLFTNLEKLEGNVGERFARLADVAELRKGVWRELYDLQNDPAEQHNIVAEERQVARELEKKLNAWIRRCGYQPRTTRLKM